MLCNEQDACPRLRCLRLHPFVQSVPSFSFFPFRLTLFLLLTQPTSCSFVLSFVHLRPSFVHLRQSSHTSLVPDSPPFSSPPSSTPFLPRRFPAASSKLGLQIPLLSPPLLPHELWGRPASMIGHSPRFHWRFPTFPLLRDVLFSSTSIPLPTDRTLRGVR